MDIPIPPLVFLLFPQGKKTYKKNYGKKMFDDVKSLV